MATIEPDIELNEVQRKEWDELASKGIRTMKVIAREHSVKNIGRLTLSGLCDEVMLRRIADRAECEDEVSNEERIARGDLSPEELTRIGERSAEKSVAQERAALERIANAAKDRERAEAELKSVRGDCNNDIKEAKASFVGSYESSVDYDDFTSVRAKLDAMTGAYASWEESIAKKIEETKPLKDALKAARVELREAITNHRQLGLEF